MTKIQCIVQDNEVIVITSNLAKHVITHDAQVDISGDDLAHHIARTLKPHLKPWKLGDACYILTWVWFVHRQLAVLEGGGVKENVMVESV